MPEPAGPPPLMDRLPIRLALVAAAALLTLAPIPIVAVLAALALLLLPGFLAIRLIPSLGAGYGRIFFVIAASLTLLPPILNVVWLTTVDRTIVIGVLVALCAILSLVRGARGGPADSLRASATRTVRWGFAAMVGYVGLCVAAHFWVPEFTAAVRPAHDYIKHHAILFELDRHPLPLRSPFYAGADNEHYAYYHYFYLWPAALRVISSDAISRAGAIASASALTSVALIGLTFVLARRVFRSDHGAWLAAACVSIVGGWDILPNLVHVALGRAPAIVLDSWLPPPWRIHSLATQFVWCPQHVAALLALLFGAEALSRAPRGAHWLILGPLLAAYIFGASAFVSMTALPAAAIVALGIALQRREPGAQPARGAVVGSLLLMLALAAPLILPQLAGYREMKQRVGSGFTPAWERLPQALLGRLTPPGPLANLLDAPWLLLVDFGLPMIALLLLSRGGWRRMWDDLAIRLLLIAGAAGLIGTYLLHDRTHDFVYGFRVCVMALNVAAAVACAAFWSEGAVRGLARRRRTLIVSVGLTLGLAVGLYELPLQAFRTLLQQSPYAAEKPLIQFLRTQTPAASVIQGHPDRRIEFLQLAERRFGVAEPLNPHVQVFTPKDAAAFRAAYERVSAAFRTPDARAAFDALHRAGIEYVVVGAIEAGQFGDCRQFDVRQYFECVFRDAASRVYRLREAPMADSETSR